VSDGFNELPSTLLHRTAASPEMIRRFRRGALDATVFSAATRRAIWRGPSIDDPSMPATILASRPIRAEVYAACVRRAARRATLWGEWGDEAAGSAAAEVHVPSAAEPAAAVAAPPSSSSTAAADAAADADAAAVDGDDTSAAAAAAASSSAAAAAASSSSAADDAGVAAAAAAAAAAAVDAATPAEPSSCVQEHIIYRAQAEAGAPELVPVPPQLFACETAWALPPQRQCGCLLRALSRASRRDRAMLHLEREGAAPLLRLGPLALVVLIVRFLRRHGLAARQLGSVLLCQGVVMAWLAAKKDALPAELRRRAAGPAASVAVAHAASLFTRAAADLAVLNSACGAPLALHGAWEWFDGVLFEAMAHAAAAGGARGSWAALLRGDATLLRVFELLLPVALGIEAEALAADQGRSSALAGAAAPPETAGWEQAGEAAALAVARVGEAAALWATTATEGGIGNPSATEPGRRE